MSYRLIDSNAIAIKYPEVNEMPCVFANLPDGLNGQFIDVQPGRKKGNWKEDKDYPNLAYLCSECNYFTTMRTNFCPGCGADMRNKI